MAGGSQHTAQQVQVLEDGTYLVIGHAGTIAGTIKNRVILTSTSDNDKRRSSYEGYDRELVAIFTLSANESVKLDIQPSQNIT